MNNKENKIKSQEEDFREVSHETLEEITEPNERQTQNNYQKKSGVKERILRKSELKFQEDMLLNEIPREYQNLNEPAKNDNYISSLDDEYKENQRNDNQSPLNNSDSFEIKVKGDSEEDFDFRPKSVTAQFGQSLKRQDKTPPSKDEPLNDHIVVLKSSDGFKKKNIKLNMSKISDKSQLISSKHGSNNASYEENPPRAEKGTIFDKMNQGNKLL